MTDFTEACEKMITSQLMPVGVRNELVLQYMRDLPREHFVPQEFKLISYSAKEIPVSKERCMLEPIVAGKIFQAADLNGTKNVLIIGDATGYFASLLSFMAGRVTVLEKNIYIPDIQKNIEQSDSLKNIKVIATDDITTGHSENAPYDMIFIHGTVKTVPDEILSQLSPNGFLIAFIKRGYICDATKYYFDDSQNIQSERIFECSVLALPEFNPKAIFEF